MKIETKLGEFEADAWHVGCEVAAAPSGFNWRIKRQEVQYCIEALQLKRDVRVSGYRSLITLTFRGDDLEILAKDTMYSSSACICVLTPLGIEQFLGVLQKAVATGIRNPGMTEEEEQEYIRAWKAAQEKPVKRWWEIWK